MKLNEHERSRLNIAGLTSPVQQAELKLLLAGRWPPLKPLPVFKYKTDEYRASIDFDKTRGEWVCRKTSLPSNKIQELRGGLREITMALPRGDVEVFAECATAEQQEQELDNEANRRLQAILEWRENYGNGALYSELQDYLSETQQDEIYDSIRMTLTARQLQFNPKNVELVFDALWNAGGRLATLMEIAQRNKAEREADAPAQAKAAALEAERQVPVEAIHPTRDRRLQKRTAPASLAYVMFGDTNGGIVVNMSEMGMAIAIAVADLLVVGDCLPRIRIQLPSSEQSIEISAQIVWLAESKKGAGIRFVDLTADARNQISNWIASEKPAPKFEQLPRLLRRDKQHLEISSRKSRRIFSTPSVRDEEAAARYAKMFPSESNDATHTTPVDETKPQQGPLLIPAATPTDASVSMFGSAAETSIHDFPQSLEASIPTEPARNFAPEPIKTFLPELSEGLAPEPVASGDRIEDSPSHFHVLEISGFQVAAFVVLFAVIGFTAGLTVGRGPIVKRLRDGQKSIPAVDATSPPLLNHPHETTSQTSTPPLASTFLPPAVNPSASATTGSRSESTPAQSFNAQPEDSATGLGPIGPSSA